MVWRLIMAGVIAAVGGWSFYRSFCVEGERERKMQEVLIEPLLLPVFIVAVPAIALILGALWGTQGVIAAVGRTFLGLFLQIGCYFLVLLLLTPLLRRRISARACATLWILPNLLYVMTYGHVGGLMSPLLVFPLPGEAVQRVLALIWIVGAAAVLAWQIASHLRFRNRLLKGARPEERSEVLNLWARERARCEKKYTIPLFVSGEIHTPVTVGCFRSTAVLVLPDKEYTQQEMTLIFRHELQHIRRADIRTKFFLAFCAAVCWFNPLLWIARKKAAEELELSCDEEVLKGADESVRRQYAELLLRTAGDGRGFSTCLSAGAVSLRYRLKNVIAPTRRTGGALCVAAAVFALFMGVSCIAFAEPVGTVEELIFDRYPGRAEIALAGFYGDRDGLRGVRSANGWQEEELIEYLGSLRVRRAYHDSYEIPANGEKRYLYLDMETVVLEEYRQMQSGTEVWNTLTVSDGLLEANIPYDGSGKARTYLLEDEVDWTYVQSLLEFRK